MANVKNFGLIGVGSDVQYGKSGPRLKHTAGTFQFRNAADGADAALTAAGITSSAGNVSLTSGNVVLSNSGTLVVGDAGSLSRQATGVYQLSGTGAIMVPNGTAAQRPASPAAAMLRFNDDADQMEFYSGSGWVTLATGGATVSSFSGGTTGLTPNTPTTGAIVLDGILVAENGGTGVDNGANTMTFGGDIDFADDFTTSGAFPITLTATASTTLTLPTTGTLLVDDDIGTTVQAWDADLDAVAGLSTTGFMVRTGSGTAATRSLTESAGRITISNPDGVSGSPTFDLATVTDAGTGTFVKITRDTYGRVSGTTAVVQGDITGLVDSVYVNVSGDTMSGNLNMGGTNLVTGLAAPSGGTDATNKNYVDSLVAGLSWKQAVRAATTVAGTLATSFEDGDVIDGVTLATGDRILIKNQADQTENGIYIVAASGAPTRSTDADTGAELVHATVFVDQGTANASSGWTQTTDAPITIGSSNIVFAQFTGAGTYTAGTGLSLSGNTFNVNLGAGIVELPTDEVGIHLFDSSTGAIILTTDGTARSTAAGAMLHLLLDGSGALTQGASGLGINTASVTNAMLVNSSITLDADSGSGSVALGGTLDIVGTTAQGVSTSTTGSQVTVTVANATTSTKGVASFDSSNFTVTAGAVSIAAGGIDLTADVTGILPVANGGTGANTLLDTAVLIGNGTGAVEATADLTFDSSTDTLAIGAADGVTVQANGGDVVITALDTDANIVLNPDGAGQVIVGPTGTDGFISADSGQDLTVSGDNLNLTASVGLLTLTSTSGDVVLAVAAGTTDKVSVSGPTASQYATGLADTDLVNKYYVDTVAGSASGDVKAVKATFSLAATGTFNIGAALPAGATILSVKANVTAADTGTGTLSVGKSGSVAAYMTTGENDTQTVGMYIAETMVTEAGSEQVIGTVAGTPAGAGSVTVVVTYQLA